MVQQNLQGRPKGDKLVYDEIGFIHVNCVKLMHKFVWKMIVNEFSNVILND